MSHLNGWVFYIFMQPFFTCWPGVDFKKLFVPSWCKSSAQFAKYRHRVQNSLWNRLLLALIIKIVGWIYDITNLKMTLFKLQTCKWRHKFCASGSSRRYLLYTYFGLGLSCLSFKQSKQKNTFCQYNTFTYFIGHSTHKGNILKNKQ